MSGGRREQLPVCDAVMVDAALLSAPPEAPAIEGVLTGISVTNEGLSQVGPRPISRT